MENLKILQVIAMISTIIAISVNGQISTPCTTSMITSFFTPCINFITGSSNNGNSPTTSCCNSLKSLMSTSMDCACLIVTANVPVQLPINRTLAISLPRACKMNGVPLQCKASGSPLPAPGPVLLGPTLPPPSAAPLSPRASKAVALAPAPESETILPLTPAFPPVQVEAPTANTGIRPVLNPSASISSNISPPISLIVLTAIIVLKCKCYQIVACVFLM
ncbi:non-specific lipid transfer protein GPI-anchored 16 [Ricinus communis]|uniref:Lipid binding protein, putative n=1 Tax=Ricinus communis TaxID=3988 RepID=B9SFI6_RICCO|nr:non-specific lipid transfer protein GPI-anchored 16 [Ricinus communis]EEF37598.1 lipid binding protein, putative [Ricinus communis]|eukprot:XP_002524755.1 non-specific lipid transfer protein-like 1 [Ricinus communis]